MLQQEEPKDFVIVTGKTYSVREFGERVFEYLGLDWERYVAIDPRYFRPTEVDLLQGDATKARKELGWEPRVGIDGLVQRGWSNTTLSWLARRGPWRMLGTFSRPEGWRFCERG